MFTEFQMDNGQPDGDGDVGGHLALPVSAGLGRGRTDERRGAGGPELHVDSHQRSDLDPGCLTPR